VVIAQRLDAFGSGYAWYIDIDLKTGKQIIVKRSVS
jgi:hypothetical protein